MNMMTVSEIARELHLSKPTIRKYLRLADVEVIVLPGKWLVPAEGFYQLRAFLMAKGY